MSDADMGLNHFSEIEVKESTLSEKATSSPHYIQLWPCGCGKYSDGMKNPNNFHQKEWISLKWNKNKNAFLIQANYPQGNI